MKKEIIIAVVCIISANLFSQTYKLETVYFDSGSGTCLSHWKVLESKTVNQLDTFSFRENNGASEVEY